VNGDYKGDDGLPLEWYINTARFYGQLRNIRIDMRLSVPRARTAGLHYQVAQATSLKNVKILATKGT